MWQNMLSGGSGTTSGASTGTTATGTNSLMSMYQNMLSGSGGTAETTGNTNLKKKQEEEEK